MEDIDWILVIGLLAMIAAGCFFGYLEHIEKMAGCVK